MSTQGPKWIAQSAYDRDKRYLACEQCGAPIEAPGGAGRVVCSHCRAPLELRMPVDIAAAPRRAHSESERTAQLASQERRYAPPLPIAHLFAGERMAPAFEGEARARWQHARASLRASGDSPAVEEFFALTLGLAELLFERGELVAQRAVVQTALELSRAATHAQLLRALLARSALRAGDPGAAEAWLALCDPRAEELLADTAYRYARAYLDTAKGDFAAVIRVLGGGGSAYSDAYAPECAVLLANAWERSGQLTMAIDTLVHAKRDLGLVARRRARRFAAAHPSWQLCSASGPESEQRVRRMDKPPYDGTGLGAYVVLSMGVGSVAWSLLGLAFIDSIGFFSILMSPGVLMGPILGGILIPLGVGSLRRAREQAALRESEVVYPAHVLRCVASRDPSEAEVRVLLEIAVLVVPDDAPAYQTSETISIVRGMESNFAPGKTLLARVDPQKPGALELEVV